MNVVKIKREKYGEALGLLIRNGGGFRTQHEATVILNSAQRLLLEAAGLVEEQPKPKKSGKVREKKSK